MTKLHLLDSNLGKEGLYQGTRNILGRSCESRWSQRRTQAQHETTFAFSPNYNRIEGKQNIRSSTILGEPRPQHGLCCHSMTPKHFLCEFRVASIALTALQSRAARQAYRVLHLKGRRDDITQIVTIRTVRLAL
jgi:hypothetical protein